MADKQTICLRCKHGDEKLRSYPNFDAFLGHFRVDHSLTAELAQGSDFRFTANNQGVSQEEGAL